MAKAIIDEQNLTDIADAIRAKNGSADTYTPSEMATAITDLPTPTPVTKGLVFSDYDADGYPTKAEFVGFTVIPQGYVQSTGSIFKNITKLVIPNGITTISSGALQLNYLEEITLPNGIVSIQNHAFGNTAIVNLTVPSSYTAITVDSFDNMEYCETITFEGDITAVARYGFEYAGRKKTTLTIDFSHCSAVPTLENANAFLGTPAKVIKVPQSLLSTWQTTGNWASVTNVTWQGV